MISVFAFAIMILNVLGIASFFSLPPVLRRLAHAELDKLGMGYAADDFVRSQLSWVAPSLYASLMLYLMGIVAALGILKRRDWARRIWIANCLLWPAIQMIFAIFMPPWDFEDTAILVFRLVILYISISILFGSEGRREFPAH